MWHGHNDMHPAFNALLPGLRIDAPESLIGGEALLAKIYNGVSGPRPRPPAPTPTTHCSW